MSEPTLADDFMKALEIVLEGPPEGMTIDEIMAKASWSCRTANLVLCELHLAGRIISERGRGARGTKVMRYRLKPKVDQ